MWYRLKKHCSGSSVGGNVVAGNEECIRVSERCQAEQWAAGSGQEARRQEQEAFKMKIEPTMEVPVSQ